MQFNLSDYDGQIKRFAKRVYNRVRSAGGMLDMEDITQECTIAFIKADEHFNSNAGVPFAAYLQRGMAQHINRWVQSEIENSNGAHLSFNTDDSDDGLAGTENLIPDPAVSAEEQLVERSHKAFVLEKLPPQVRMFVQLLDDPPEDLLREHQAMRAKAADAKEHGFQGLEPQKLSASFVMDFMGASRQDRTIINRTIRAILEQA